MTVGAAGKVVALIPARGGSKSIPMKNIRDIAGKPLVQWTLEAAADAACIDEVFLATDDHRIASVVDDMQLPKVNVVGRTPETATDEASTESVLLEFCESYQFRYVFLIQATSPLLTAGDLERAWESYVDARFASLISVVRQKRFHWDNSGGEGVPLNYDPRARPRRQDFDGVLVENGAFYLSSREAVLRDRCRLSSPVGFCEMGEATYFEIDEPADWSIVEGLLTRRKRGQKTVPGKISLVVMDCDGVLTDAGMYYTDKGELLKKFNTRDGKGIEKLRQAGVRTAIITGERTDSVVRRAEKLKIDEVVLGSVAKDRDLWELCAKFGISPKEVAYIGDDVNDLPAMVICGFSACPADAVEAVRRVADLVLEVPGGRGAVRALVDAILE